MTRLQNLFVLLTVLPLGLLPVGAVVTMVLTGLRVVDEPPLPWLWVFAPIWGLLGLSATGLVLGLLIGFLIGGQSRPSRQPRSGPGEG